MGIMSIFQSGAKYFDKKIDPKCDYCQFGKRAKDGNKVLCEKKGLVDCNYSCSKFIYSPLKRIPVKQLNFVGSLADDDIYIESAGERAEKEAEEKKAAAANEAKTAEKKTEANPVSSNEAKSENASEPKKEETAPAENTDKETE